MSWLQLSIDTSAELAALCEDVLLAAGALSVTLQDNADQPLYHTGNKEEQSADAILWRQTRVSGLFPADTDTASLWQAMPEAVRAGSQHRAEILEDKDWEREWMQHYQPRQYAEGLWICPSWLEPPEPAAVNIMLDPGLAFGTGTHPTTAMCLQQLGSMALDQLRVVDYGCGSGILAIAALLLGARSVLAVDTDPQALLACRDNAERNAVAAEKLTIHLPADAPDPVEADLVVANILAGPLCQLASVLSRQLVPGARLLLSGVLEEQVPLLQATYRDHLDLEVADTVEGWVLLRGNKA